MTIAIITAEINGLGYYDNQDRTNALRSELLNAGVDFVGVTIHAPSKQQAFMMRQANIAPISTIAEILGIASFFVTDPNSLLIKINLKKDERLTLGKLNFTSTFLPNESSFYLSFTEDGKEHFLTTKQGKN